MFQDCHRVTLAFKSRAKTFALSFDLNAARNISFGQRVLST
jgi:hypothetical protein